MKIKIHIKCVKKEMLVELMRSAMYKAYSHRAWTKRLSKFHWSIALFHFFSSTS